MATPIWVSSGEGTTRGSERACPVAAELATLKCKWSERCGSLYLRLGGQCGLSWLHLSVSGMTVWGSPVPLKCECGRYAPHLRSVTVFHFHCVGSGTARGAPAGGTCAQGILQHKSVAIKSSEGLPLSRAKQHSRGVPYLNSSSILGVSGGSVDAIVSLSSAFAHSSSHCKWWPPRVPQNPCCPTCCPAKPSMAGYMTAAAAASKSMEPHTRAAGRKERPSPPRTKFDI